jgi:hypothetical protein
METFDLGRVLQTAEAIKGMRQQSVTEKLRQQYMGNQESRAVAAERRAATQFSQEQQIENTRLLNAASAEIAQNPQAASRWLPQLKQAGVLAADYDPSSMAPEELQAQARQIFESTKQALSAYSQAAGSGNVHSTFQGGNGNAWIITRDGRHVDTGVPMQKFSPQTIDVGGGVDVFDPNRPAAPRTTIATPDQQIGAAAREAAAVRGAQEAATTAAIPERVQAQATAERAATAPQRLEKVRQITSGIDNTIKTVDIALADASMWTTGAIGAMAKAVPGSKAFDLQQTLLTVKANLGFDRLQQMREASPTGGALGNVAIQELNALQAALASLDQAQSEGALKRGLRNVKSHYENWRDAVTEANADVAQPGNQPQGQTRRVRVDAEGNVIQ